jgi:hypothetical protein
MLIAGIHADLDYFEAVSQVIPVLLLALAIGEARMKFRRELAVRDALVGALFILLVMAAGEAGALRALAERHGTETEIVLTALSVAFGLALVANYLLRATYREFTEADEDDEIPRVPSLIITLGMSVIAVATVLILLA